MKANEKGKREKQGGKKGVRRPKQPGPPLSLPPLCPIPLAALNAASTSLSPMCGEKRIAGTGLDPYRGASGVGLDPYLEGQSDTFGLLTGWRLLLLAFRAYIRSSLHCGQSIAMNSCEYGTTNACSPSFRG